MRRTSNWYNEETKTVGTVVRIHEDGVHFYARFDGDDFDWYVDVNDVYPTNEPLPVAEQPAVEADPEFVPFTVGQRIRCDDNRGAPGYFNIGDFYTVKSVEDCGRSALVWVEEVDAAMCAYRFSAAPVGLQIEVGKFYKTRDGRKVGPLRKRDDYFTDGTWHYAANGECCYKGRSGEHVRPEHDLVAEWVDDAPVTAVEAAVATATAAPKFKVGDRVRIVRNTRGDEHLNKEIGREFTITTRDGFKNEGWSGDAEENYYWWPSADLELVTTTPEPANDNTVTLTLNIDTKPAAEALRTLADALIKAADEIAA